MPNNKNSLHEMAGKLKELTPEQRTLLQSAIENMAHPPEVKTA